MSPANLNIFIFQIMDQFDTVEMLGINLTQRPKVEDQNNI